RHGPTVLDVCRRVPANHSHAGDALQATFLLPVRKAPSLGARPLPWGLAAGVAPRPPPEAKGPRARRPGEGRPPPPTAAPAAPPRTDWLPLPDEELARLPDKYRLPIVLCDLEGKTRGEAAEQLCWPEGTVAGRLARGRALLGKRLVRRVHAPSAALPALFNP